MKWSSLQTCGIIKLKGRHVTILIVYRCFSLLSANACWKHACAHYMLLTCKLQRAACIIGLVLKGVKPLFSSLPNCKYADVSVFICMVNWCTLRIGLSTWKLVALTLGSAHEAFRQD